MKNFFYKICILCVLTSCTEMQKSDKIDLNASDLESYLVTRSDVPVTAYNSIGSTNSNQISTLSNGGILTAGQWNDIQNWPFWNQLIQKKEYYKYQSYWGIYPNNCYVIQVLNGSKPQVDVEVSMVDDNNKKLWVSRTDVNGFAYLFSDPFRDIKTIKQYIIIEKNVKSLISTFDKLKTSEINTVQINNARVIPKNLDILFIMDATASMEDEMYFLKNEFQDVMNRCYKQLNDFQIKSGAVFYRDVDDEYITRSIEFDDNIENVLYFIQSQNADGGGDYPEALDQALDTALSLNWSEDAFARIAFIFLDAPAHNDEISLNSVKRHIKRASSKGINLIPIASSGVDKDTEFLSRFMSLLTNGNYLFLTDHSGIGNEHLEPTVGKYEIQYLNDLLLDVINKKTIGTISVNS